MAISIRTHETKPSKILCPTVGRWSVFRSSTSLMKSMAGAF